MKTYRSEWTNECYGRSDRKRKTSLDDFEGDLSSEEKGAKITRKRGYIPTLTSTYLGNAISRRNAQQEAVPIKGFQVEV